MDQYSIHVRREVDPAGQVVWVAWHPRLEGCVAQGSTPDEAVESLAEARRMVLAHLRQHGLPVPLGDTNIKSCLIFVH